MTRPLANPALHTLAAAGALLVFTWPFLVFDRPIQVFVYFFASWASVIGVLFAFSRARESAEAPGPGTDEDNNA